MSCKILSAIYQSMITAYSIFIALFKRFILSFMKKNELTNKYKSFDTLGVIIKLIEI